MGLFRYGLLVIIFSNLFSFYADAAPFAYISNRNSGSISVVDVSSSLVVATITDPNLLVPESVAINQYGTKAYVAYLSGVLVVDVATNTIDGSISAGFPQGLALSPDGSRLYAARSGPGTVVVLDTASRSVVTTITLASGSGPSGIVVSPDGNYVYVSNALTDTVSVIDTSTNSVVNTINVGDEPQGVAVTPGGDKLYVANALSDTVSVIDTGTQTVVSTIPVGDVPFAIAASPDGNSVYVGNNGVSASVSVIDVSNDTVSGTISLPAVNYSRGISVTSDSSLVYVTDAGGNDVSIIDVINSYSVSTLAVQSGPYSFGVFIGGSTAPTYTIGGTISGLSASGLVLADTSAGSSAITSGATSFTLPTALTSGASYSVTVQTQPTGQSCAVSNGSGTVASSNITNVSVICTTPASVPTLSEWAQLMLALMTIGVAWHFHNARERGC